VWSVVELSYDGTTGHTDTRAPWGRRSFSRVLFYREPSSHPSTQPGVSRSTRNQPRPPPPTRSQPVTATSRHPSPAPTTRTRSSTWHCGWATSIQQPHARNERPAAWSVVGWSHVAATTDGPADGPLVSFRRWTLLVSCCPGWMGLTSRWADVCCCLWAKVTGRSGAVGVYRWNALPGLEGVPSDALDRPFRVTGSRPKTRPACRGESR
jgi:hypothetical protein